MTTVKDAEVLALWKRLDRVVLDRVVALESRYAKLHPSATRELDLIRKERARIERRLDEYALSS
jgi:hypothetical protein